MRILIASDLSDTQLETEVKRLAGCERVATASLLAHLAELETRHIHLSAGFPSLFSYCTNVLRLSEAAAYNRIVAARTVRRFPRILDLLVEGSLNLTSVKLLAPYLTDDNFADLAADTCRKKRSEVEELLARRFPKPDAPDSVRKLPAFPPAPSPMPAAETRHAGSPPTSPVPATPAPAPPSVNARIAPGAAMTTASPRATITSLATDRYQFTFTGDRETRDMLELARDLLRHAIPGGETAAIVKKALKMLLADLARTRFAATDRPRATGQPDSRSRHVAAHVKRAVWLRDQGCCAFVGESGRGRRCRERAYLEFHHVVPYASGGPTTADNLQLRCRAHNAYAAERDFGERRPRGEWDVARMPAVAVGAWTTRPRTSSGGAGPLTNAARQPTVPSAQTASGP